MSKWYGLSVRVPVDTAEVFRTRAELMGRTVSSVMLELIEAFNEGRVTIRENPDKKKIKQELYK